MTDTIIRIENLGKRYRIGLTEKRPETWRETAAAWVGSPFRYLRQMSRPPTDEETLWALRNVTFEIKRGEAVGIVGRNGAGKSTLLKILSRITEPTEGRAIIHGRIGSLLEVGTGFHPELNGRENIYLNGAILGMKRREIDRKFDEIVAFAEIEKFIDTPVKRYSSGMYVRLAFAVAAHLEPDILIVDEVLAVGDASFQKKCLGKMGEVTEIGRTVLFVSHNMSAMARLCSRAVLMQAGQLVEDGAVEGIVGSYLNSTLAKTEVKRWTNLDEAPGTEQVKLAFLGILSASREPMSVVNIEEPIHITMGYYVGVANARFRCSVTLFTQGASAFSTVETVEANRERLGYYESVVTIPGNLLAEGDYTITVSIFASRGVKNRHVFMADALGFHVFDPMSGNSARGDYAERFAGVVRPHLPWQMSYLGTGAAPPPLPGWGDNLARPEESELANLRTPSIATTTSG